MNHCIPSGLFAQGGKIQNASQAIGVIARLIRENGIRECCEGAHPFLEVNDYEGLAEALSIIGEHLYQIGAFQESVAKEGRGKS
tara:strand:+ start:648 stop:899 length:252 start_codon:yes stop_codon:yes gene_type:complete